MEQIPVPVFFYRYFAIRYNSTMNLTPGNTTLDYLIVGHITRDVVDNGFRLGGTALYSAITAMRLGLEVGLVTSYNESFSIKPLEGIHIINFKSERTITFRNVYTPSGREQWLLEKAEFLGMEHIPEE